MKLKFRKIIVRLLRYNNTPPEIALGVAIGVFIGILPVYGLHTILVIIAALLIRPANKIAIFAGTNISLPPMLWGIIWASYEIGRFILKGRFDPLTWEYFRHLTLKNIANRYEPLFLGSLVLGLFAAIVFYFLTYFIVKGIHDRRKDAKHIQRKNKKI